MNLFSNLWKHPRTSTAGVLISVTTVAGVLSAQGVTLGKVGGGTVVSLAAALATALLGMLARDPGQPSAQPIAAPIPAPAPCTNCTGDCANQSSSTAGRLGAWLLIGLLLPLPWLEGCTGNQVARNIVDWTPALQSAVATVDSSATLLAPADASAFAAATAGFDAASDLLIVQARAYLANPTASTLAQLQAQIVTLEQQVNGALLSAARIVDPASQQHAMASIQAVATIVTAILALVQSVSSKADLAGMADRSTIKLAAVAPYLDSAKAARTIAVHYSEPLSTAQNQIAAAEQIAINSGF